MWLYGLGPVGFSSQTPFTLFKNFFLSAAKKTKTWVSLHVSFTPSAFLVRIMYRLSRLEKSETTLKSTKERQYHHSAPPVYLFAVHSRGSSRTHSGVALDDGHVELEILRCLWPLSISKQPPHPAKMVRYKKIWVVWRLWSLISPGKNWTVAAQCFRLAQGLHALSLYATSVSIRFSERV